MARAVRCTLAVGILLAVACSDSSTHASDGTSGTQGQTGGLFGDAASGGNMTGGLNSKGGAEVAATGATIATGGTNTGQTGGVAGSTDATGGSTNVTGGTGDGGVGGSDAGPSLIWPNDDSKANSDDWLVQHHDDIAQLQPRVLVIDLENTASAADLVQRHIDALAYSSSFHKYKDDSAEPALQYQLVKIVQASKGGGATIDYNSWNTQSFADDNVQITDPSDPNGPNLTLCELFERGVINEVWCMASQNPKCGETQEAKQVYTNADPPQKMAGKFVSASNGDNITSLGCQVTVRITDFNSGRGTGCHQHAMGHGWERYMDSSAVPMLRKQAGRFLNWDLDTRVGAPFSNFYSACQSNGSQLTDCMIWDSEIAMHSGPTASSTFSIDDMSEGCGNAHFYPNTTGTYSYDANTPDPTVLSSCEHYGMHDGANGKDQTSEFNNAMTDQLYGRSPNPIYGACAADATPACSDDCGGHGTAYLYQNFPGPGTTATNDDSTPMHNWWVYLFY